MQWVPAFGDRAPFDALSDRAVSGEAFGVVVRVASLEDLLYMKRHAGRPQDLQDVDALTLAHPDRTDEED